MPMTNANQLEPHQTADLAAGRLPKEPGEGERTVDTDVDTAEEDRLVFRRLTGGATELESEEEGEPTPGAEGAGESLEEDLDTLEPERGQQPRPDAGAKTPERLELELIAKATLMRDHGDEDVVKTLLKLPTPKLKALIEKRRKVQRDGDQLGNRVAALERQLREGKAPKTGQADAERETGGEVDGEPSETMLDDLIDLAATGDTTAAQLLKKYRKQLTSAPAARERPRTEARPDDVQDPDVRNAVLLGKLRAPLDQLAKRYPSLRKDSARLQLVDCVERLYRAGAFDKDAQIEQMLETAAATQFPTDAKTARTREAARYSKEREGQPEAGGEGRTPPAAMSEEQGDRLAFRLLAKGHSPRRVASHLGSRRAG